MHRDPVLWAVLAVQAALALPVMVGRTLWLDEAYSAILARRSMAGIRAALEHDSGPPLYYALLHLWRRAFGESPLALRTPSLLFGLGSTLLLYRLAARRFGRSTARVAAALFATLPLTVFYAGEARNYTLLALLALLLASLLVEPRWGRVVRLVGVSAVLVALVYNHNIGWIVAAAFLGAGALAYGGRVLTPWLVLPLLAVVAAFLPWYPVLRVQAANIAWVRGLWSPWGPLQSIAAVPAFGYVPAYLDLPSLPGWWWVCAVALWLVPLVFASLRLARTPQRDTLFVVASIVLGLAIPAIASLVQQPMSLPGRHDFFLVPLIALLAAVGLQAMPAALRRGGVVLLVGGAIWASASYARLGVERDERGWVAVLAERGAPGDVVLCAGLTRPPAEYYLDGRGLVFVSYPRAMAEDLAHLDDGRYLASDALPADARAAVQDAVDRARGGGRVWVLASPRAVNRPLLEALEGHRSLLPEPPIREPGMGMRLLRESIAVLPYRVRSAPP